MTLVLALILPIHMTLVYIEQRVEKVNEVNTLHNQTILNSMGSVVKLTKTDGVPRGSGFFIAPHYILTNAHVVSIFKHLSIVTNDIKNTRIEAEVIASDTLGDVGLLYVKDYDRPVVTLGDSDTIRLLDKVYSIGSPYGFINTLGIGQITGLKRELILPPYHAIIQVNTGIAPGNSGGALFNSKGEVIGLVYAAMTLGHPLGFAIPINDVKGFIKESIELHQLKLKEQKK